MSDLYVYGFFAVIGLLAIGTWIHARSIEPPHEYYEEEFRELGIYEDMKETHEKQ